MMARHRLSKLGVLPLLAFAAAACDNTPPPAGMALGEELYETCAPCHGPVGAGNPEIEAPAIAGLPQWYIENQLRSFQNGFRGKHASDIPALRMRPMAVTLNRAGDVESVAQFVAAMPETFPASTLHGNAGAGAERYETVCATCHGQDARGDQAQMAPPLVQMHDWYLAQEMRNYRDGARGANPEDAFAFNMRSQAAFMTDEQIEDVIAYVQTLR